MGYCACASAMNPSSTAELYVHHWDLIYSLLPSLRPCIQNILHLFVPSHSSKRSKAPRQNYFLTLYFLVNCSFYLICVSNYRIPGCIPGLTRFHSEIVSSLMRLIILFSCTAHARVLWSWVKRREMECRGSKLQLRPNQLHSVPRFFRVSLQTIAGDLETLSCVDYYSSSTSSGRVLFQLFKEVTFDLTRCIVLLVAIKFTCIILHFADM